MRSEEQIMPPVIFDRLPDSDRMLLDTLEAAVAHEKQFGRSIKVIRLSKNFWDKFLDIMRRGYSEEEWETRKEMDFYLDPAYAHKIEKASDLQVDRISYELWELKTAEA